MPVAIAAPPKYTRRVGAVRPPRASPAPSVHGSRSRSRSSTPGAGPKCTHCGARTLSREDAGLICQSCGVIVQEDSNFRAEVEFDEGGNGGTQVRGTQVRHDQTHQKQYTNRVGNASRVGLESSPAFDNALREARSCIKTTATALRINDPEVDAGLYIFRKAYERQFYRGRTLQAVAMVSLYLAIRRVRRGHKYPLMLIDFAEAAVPQLNVFEMGKMAKELQSKLYLTEQFRKDWGSLENQKRGADPSRRAELSAQQDNLHGRNDYIVLNLQDPEDLIAKFCEKLDFGDKQRDIMDDAVKVAKCMDRDWMTTGRRPAGIAGAAVIIAARMNNYRRTLREVVLVAKVTEITLSKRIEEFKETKRSTLSVKDFKNINPDSVPVDESQMPPSYYRAQPEWQAKQAAKKNGRGKRKRKNGEEGDTAAEIENGEEPPTDTENESEAGEQDNENEETNAEEPPAKRPRLDADGFAVPDLPNRTSSTPQSEVPPRKRGVGKPKGAKNWKPPPPTEEELAAENELSEDIRDQLRRNASLDPTGTVVPAEAPSEPGPSSATTSGPSSTPTTTTGPGVVDMYPSPWTSKEQGPPVDSNIGNTSATTGDANLDDLDFEDDPDVANCVLSEQERVIKETIWVTENADWLRTEHAKKIKRELKDRELREKGIDPEKERLKKLRRKDGMLRAGRAGDIAYLEEAKNKKRAQVEGEDGEAGEDEVEPEEDARARRQRVSQSARDSVQMMLQQRGTFSRRVDYNKLSQAYVLPGFEDSSESRSESPDRPDPNHFYRMAATRGAQTSSKRRARKTASRMAGIIEEDESNANDNRSRSRSKSTSQPAQIAENAEEEEEDAEYELDEGTAKSPVPPISATYYSPFEPLTPAATQAQTQTQTRPTAVPKDLRLPSTGPDGSESPLSSTHTPAGYGSGAPNTPLPTQLPETSAVPEGVGKEDNDDEEDDDDEVDDDEDDEVDEDLDQYFAGGEQMMGEAEEVVDDDF